VGDDPVRRELRTQDGVLPGKKERRGEQAGLMAERLRLVVAGPGAAPREDAAPTNGSVPQVALPAAERPPSEAGRAIVPHVPSLYACVRALVGDPQPVEDIVHETVAQALASWGRYDPTRDLGAWLRGIAVHVTKRYWRKARRGRAATTELADALREAEPRGLDPESDLSGREQAGRLLVALDSLTQSLREAFVLRVVEGLPTEEVARLTHTSEAAVYTRVCKARALLVAAIEAERVRRGKRRCDDDGT
jgi:RNA polymerase sigma factor (sigma-70 family)